MKALLAICTLAFSTFAAAASLSELGPLTNYYGDCPARLGPQADYLRSVIRRALRGDLAAMRLLIRHEGVFSTGDNEGYSEVPQVLLRALGDRRYAAFITRQRRDVQELALALYPEQIPAFDRRFPKTATLYHERFGR